MTNQPGLCLFLEELRSSRENKKAARARAERAAGLVKNGD
jgi:hypothetical protein